MKTIVLTGGGSGGHIAPIRAVASELQKNKELYWIGSSYFEENAAAELNIFYKKIHSGKMRRGMNIKNIFKNIIDIFWIKIGFVQSFLFLRKLRPEKVFSTGGFVSVPVVAAAWLLRIPVVVHEQTIGFGLANKIASFYSTKILLAFPESKQHISKKYHHKIEIVGNPIRTDLMNGSFEKLQKFLNNNFEQKKPMLYITGGGQGSQLINETIFELLPKLAQDYYVIHQCGKGGIEKAQKQSYADYFPFEFIGSELADIYACADIVIARSGAGTVNELDYFNIYSIFAPLQPVQNDEQMKNAEWFLQNNDGRIIKQNNFNSGVLMTRLNAISIPNLKRDEKTAHAENNSAGLIVKNIL